MQGRQTKGNTPLCLHEKRITGDLQVIEGIDDIFFFFYKTIKPKSLSAAGKRSLDVSFTSTDKPRVALHQCETF